MTTPLEPSTKRRHNASAPRANAIREPNGETIPLLLLPLLVEDSFLAIAKFLHYRQDVSAFLGLCKTTMSFAIVYYKTHIPLELHRRQMFATPGVTEVQAWHGEFVLWLLLRQLPKEEPSLAIAGSFPLHTHMRAEDIHSTKPWHPTDVDIYFTGKSACWEFSYIEQVEQHVEKYKMLVKHNLGVTLRYKTNNWKPYYASHTSHNKHTWVVVDICLPKILTKLGMTCLSFIARPVWIELDRIGLSLLRHESSIYMVQRILWDFDMDVTQVGLRLKRRENDPLLLQFIITQSTQIAIRNQQLKVLRAGHPKTPSRLLKYFRRGFTVVGKKGLDMFSKLPT